MNHFHCEAILVWSAEHPMSCTISDSFLMLPWSESILIMRTRLGVTAPNNMKDQITHDLMLVNMN